MAKCQTGVLKASRSWGLIGAQFWRSAGETFGRSDPPKGCPTLFVFSLGFEAFETTSRSRLKDAFQEACTEDSFTAFPC
jgi:hypothetical protein